MNARIAAVAAIAAIACTLPVFSVTTAGAAPTSAAPAVLQLSGTLHLTKGTCEGGRPEGSYLSVTYGTKAIENSASDCDGGAVTLLSPGDAGLSTTSFSPSSDIAFDSRGNAVATSIAKPVAFGHHLLGVVSASQDLQDAPGGPALFALPHIYVTGASATAETVLADLRSVQVLYNRGCWLVGAERATGTYDATTHRMTLTWFTGRSFVSTSAGTAVHLAGVFVGASPKPVAHGDLVELGTSSFAAGPAADGQPARRVTPIHDEASTATPIELLADPHTSPITQVFRSPLALALAVLLIGIDSLGFAAVFGRRRKS